MNVGVVFPSSSVNPSPPPLVLNCFKLRPRTYSKHFNSTSPSLHSLKNSPSLLPLQHYYHISRAVNDLSLSSPTSRDRDDIAFDWKEGGEEEAAESPWEGAVIYTRDASVTHLEYCTTLERLGLGKVSTDVSKSKASAIGLRLTKAAAAKDYPNGTPVLISVDVCRKKNKKIRLDGIIRTVLTLDCNRCVFIWSTALWRNTSEIVSIEYRHAHRELEERCGEPCAECIFSNFTLLLTEEPIEETDVINLGIIFGDDKQKTASSEEDEDDDDDALIDLDDRLHFPAEKKEIDISKNIRDLVHLEIIITAICDSKCRGICLKCGANLNISSCNCSKQELEKKSYGPLGNLRNQMQRNQH